jgi:ubiquinone/menaquinone biosynthesis C-methylase UbiE
MGFYSRNVFPRLMDWALGAARLQQERRTALAPVRGDVLEIGFGTGLNLGCYPPGVTRLVAIDEADLLPARVAQRVAAAPFPVERTRLDAERLPFPDARFDCAVSTWTLCSIPDAVAALRELRRVLRPGGLYVFLEHGRSDDPRVARRQDRFNPIQRWVGSGCNINRPIDRLVGDAGFEIGRLERYVRAGEPRILAEMYRGTASPRAS